MPIGRKHLADSLTLGVGAGTAAGMLIAAVGRWELGLAVGLHPFVLAFLVAGIACVPGVIAGGTRDIAALIATGLGGTVVAWESVATSLPAPTFGLSTLGGLVLGFVAGALRRRQPRSEPSSEAQRSPSGVRWSPRHPMEPVWIILPTYMERENIRRLLPELRRMAPTSELLVVDDASPDGTAEVVRELAREDDRLHLLVRPGERGFDGALLAGIGEALSRGSRSIVTMDGDGSHDPRDVPRLLDALEEAEIVVGSRYVTGGSTAGWGVWRRLVSRAANTYARAVLGLRIRDCSSGFRAYRADALRAVLPDVPRGAGYALLEALLLTARRRGLSIREIPIHFRPRCSGRSKLSPREALQSARFLWRLADRRTERRTRALHGFTLLELLTVIAIITILAGLLFPVLASARRSAQKTTCRSNLRQLALALQLYAEDYDELLPRWFNGDTVAGVWDRTVSTYVRADRVFHCPSNSKSLPGAIVRSYAFPRNVSGLPLAAVPRPSESVLLYEKGGEALGERLDATGEYFYQTYGLNDFRFWHEGGKMFAFIDGHVRFWPLGQGPWSYDFRPPQGNNNYGPGYCGGQINTYTDDDGGPGKNLPP
jgi:dolichol-phosphate mannosyltransferase